jgi:hypothetical protein
MAPNVQHSIKNDIHLNMAQDQTKMKEKMLNREGTENPGLAYTIS